MAALSDKTVYFHVTGIRLGVDFFRDGMAICWHEQNRQVSVVGQFNWRRDSRAGQREQVCKAIRRAREQVLVGNEVRA